MITQLSNDYIVLNQWVTAPSPAVAQTGPWGARCEVNMDLNWRSLYVIIFSCLWCSHATKISAASRLFSPTADANPSIYLVW